MRERWMTVLSSPCVSFENYVVFVGIRKDKDEKCLFDDVSLV